MFRFPSDVQRRKQWAINTRRDNWFPTNNSRLCEVITFQMHDSISFELYAIPNQLIPLFLYVSIPVSINPLNIGTCWKLSSLILFPGWCCVEWYILSELWMMSSSKECGNLFAIR